MAKASPPTKEARLAALEKVIAMDGSNLENQNGGFERWRVNVGGHVLYITCNPQTREIKSVTSG